MAVLGAAALIGAIGVIVPAFCATMTYIEIAKVRKRTILKLDVQYVPTRNYRIEKLAA